MAQSTLDSHDLARRPDRYHTSHVERVRSGLISRIKADNRMILTWGDPCRNILQERGATFLSRNARPQISSAQARTSVQRQSTQIFLGRAI
jgi:hypothetical protein